jgi:hypothetical protein
MRLRIVLPIAILCLGAASSTVLRAQFQEPSQEELKMTEEPKAPGADAVYLYREDLTDQSAGTRSFYERIKVLTEKGKDMATIRIPYEVGADKVADVQGRTIHADGTVIALTEKPSDLVDYKTKGYQLNRVVFTLPSVEVGSILEFRVKIHYSLGAPEPTWMIQQSDFVHKAHYSFKTYGGFSSLSYASAVGSDAKVVFDKKSTYTLDVTDVPPLPDDDWMPPLNTFKWRVRFFYSDYKSGAEFWDYAEKHWSTAVRELVSPTGTLKKAVAEIVAPGDSETQKAQKIYAAVMKIENTDFTRHKSEVERKKEKIKEIKKVEDVWKQQTGTSDDIALLFVAMARAASLNVEPMVVVNRDRALFDQSFLNSGQMDDFIAVGQLDGKEVFLDPGEKMCPFGVLHWKHAVTSGFRLKDKVAAVAQTPSLSLKSSGTQRVASLNVDAAGEVSGSVRVVMTGQDALYWRQLALQNDEEEVKKQYNERMREYLPDGVHAEFDHFLGLEDYQVNLIGTVKVSGTLGAATGKHFFLPGLFFEASSKHPFVKLEKRLTPVDVHYAKMEEDDVTYHLPAGYAIESTVQATNNTWPDHAVLKISSHAGADTVNVVRVLAYNYTILGPADYASLHDFYQKVAAADQQQLVLARTAVAKGN